MAKLYFYYSTMNAGKTTALLQSRYNYHERGMRVLLLTPRLDNRAGVGVIKSRAGLEASAIVFNTTDDLQEIVSRQHEDRKISCVMVDESQFLSRDQVYQLSEVVDQLGIPVLAYGLRTDFQGELFEGSHYLLAWADELVELKTICHTGKKANMVVRVDEDGLALTEGAQVEIGGNDRYVSVCRAEFKKIFYGAGKLDLAQQLLPFDEFK